MKLIVVGILATLCVATSAHPERREHHHEHNKVVCYWNPTSFDRHGSAKFQIDDLRPALSLCTHLVYGYAGVNAEHHGVTALHPNLDTKAGHAFFKVVPELKNAYPDLKVYLSIGGNVDPYEETREYLTVTESEEARAKFVNSIGRLASEYDFDGIDLAWQFPTYNIRHDIRKEFGYGKFRDEDEAEHRHGFSILVRDLKNHLRSRNEKDLTLTVLPHINASVYFDVRSLDPHIDAVHIFAFDQKTPERDPEDADYAAPIYESNGRVRDENIHAGVRFWLEHGTPGSKIVVGIPTYARTWRLTSDSQESGVPPVDAEGPGAPGPHTQVPGLLSYPEVCDRLEESIVGHLRHVNDPSKKYGSYAFQSYNYKTEADGIWVSYENPETAGNKAAYVKSKELGGVAIVDLSLDDFRGTCNGDKYPILKAAKHHL